MQAQDIGHGSMGRVWSIPVSIMLSTSNSFGQPTIAFFAVRNYSLLIQTHQRMLPEVIVVLNEADLAPEALDVCVNTYTCTLAHWTATREE